MTKEKFNEIWCNILLPIYDEISLKANVYIRPFAKEIAYRKYQKKKTYLKINYMQNPNTHLDRHKIAACMMYAIVSSHPILIKPSAIWNKYVKKEKFPIKHLLLNEYLGIYTALSIVQSFKMYNEGQDNDNVNQKIINMPITTNGEDYIYNTCLDLYLSKKKKNINVLTFANVFFLLETGTFGTGNKES